MLKIDTLVDWINTWGLFSIFLNLTFWALETRFSLKLWSSL